MTGYWDISGPDSSLYIFVNGKYIHVVGRNWMSNHAVLKGLASGTNYSAFLNASGQLVEVPGFFTDSATSFSFSKHVYFNQPVTFGSSSGVVFSSQPPILVGGSNVVIDGSGNIKRDTTIYAARHYVDSLGGTAVNIYNSDGRLKGFRVVSFPHYGLFLGDDSLNTTYESIDVDGANIRLNTQDALSQNALIMSKTNTYLGISTGVTNRANFIQVDTVDVGLLSYNNAVHGYQFFLNQQDSTAIFEDNLRFKGIEYENDYSANFTDNSLISRKAAKMIVDSLFHSATTIFGNITVDPTTGTSQPGIRFNHGSYVDFYDGTNTTSSRLSQQSGEFWIANNGSSNNAVLKGGQWYNRDNMGVETPYLKQGDVAPRDSIKYNTPILGTLYNNNNFTSTADFTANGATASLSGNQLVVTGSTLDFTHSLDLPFFSLLDKWKVTVDFIAPTATSGAAFAIGKRSVNTVTAATRAANIDLGTSGTAGTLTLFGGNNGAATLTTAPNKLEWTAGDTLRMTIERDGITTYFEISDHTHPYYGIVGSYLPTTIGTGATAPVSIDNVGHYALFARSSTPINVVAVNVTSTDIKGADIAIVTDSKWGGVASTYGNSLPGILSQNYSVLNLGGTSDQTGSVINHLPEIYSLAPKAVMLEIGSNNIRQSISLASTEADIDTIYNRLTAHGIKVYVSDQSYETSINLLPLSTWTRSQFTTNYIPIYTSTGASKAYLYTDGVHLTDTGYMVKANTIIRSGFFTGAKSAFILQPNDLFNALGQRIDKTSTPVFAGLQLSGLNAAKAVFTNSSGVLVANNITGTGNVVMSASPALTGSPTAPTAAANISTTQVATMAAVKAVNVSHGIFVPTTGNTITLVNHQYNIINPAGTLAALTFVMPASPVDGDVVYIKFIQSVTTVTWPAAVKGAATSQTADNKVTLVYDSASTNWY